MINGEQMLTAFAHGPLSGEHVFRRCFVSNLRVRRQVSQPIDRLRDAIAGPADQAAAFVGSGFAGVCDDFIELISCYLNSHLFRSAQLRSGGAKCS